MIPNQNEKEEAAFPLSGNGCFPVEMDVFSTPEMLHFKGPLRCLSESEEGRSKVSQKERQAAKDADLPKTKSLIYFFGLQCPLICKGVVGGGSS